MEWKKVFEEITVNVFPNLMVEAEFRDIGVRRLQNSMFILLKGKKNCQPRILYPPIIIFNN